MVNKFTRVHTKATKITNISTVAFVKLGTHDGAFTDNLSIYIREVAVLDVLGREECVETVLMLCQSFILCVNILHEK